MTPPRNTAPAVLCAAAVLLLSAVFGAKNLILPFGRDQGLFAFAADRCLQGDVLYRDVYVDKPPMAVLTFMLAQAAFGHSMTAVRILDLLWMVATALLVAAVAKRLLGAKLVLAALAAALFALAYGGLDFWNTAQSDGWLLLPTTLAVWLVLRRSAGEAACDEDTGRRGVPWAVIASGAALALAFLFKYTAALLLVVPLLALSGDPERPRRARNVGALLLGFALPMIALFVWLEASGAANGFLDSQVRWLSHYASVREGGGVLRALQEFAVYFATSFPVLAVTGVLGAAWTLAQFARALRTAPSPRTPREALRAPLLLWAWTAAAALGVFAQGKYFVYHFLPLAAPLALLGAWLARDVLAKLPDRLRAPIRRSLVPVAIVLALVLAPAYRNGFRDLVNVCRGATSLSDYWGRPEFATLDFSLRDDLLLVRALEERTGAGDRVNLWGFEPLVNFLAHRRPVGRFAYSAPLLPEAGLPVLRSEYVQALQTDAPECFVIQRGDAIPFALGHRKDSGTTFKEFPELVRLVDARYELQGTVGNLDQLGRPEEPRFFVFRRRE